MRLWGSAKSGPVGRAARSMAYRRTWACGCGATMTIRAREDRRAGPSNYAAYQVGHPLAGHAQLPSSSLTWNGLLEERGWRAEPVTCPACLAGMSVRAYKARGRG